MAQATIARTDAAGTAGVIARPPLIFLLLLLAGSGADHLLPLPRVLPGVGLAHWISAAFAAVLLLAGAGLVAAGMRNFVRAGTPVPTDQPTRALVTAGIHRWTRNPIYLGMLLFYLGIGIMMRSSWILLLWLPFAIIIRVGVVAREEKYLEARFGDAYLQYRKRVRRWL
jgi:protein-S-isoprenylcysteine O-methyltransferase Ste14